MKNLLVILVTVGIGYAYWYQRPEEAVPPAPPAATPVEAPARRPAFVAAHTALDEPATPIGTRSKQSSVVLGTDKLEQPR